MAASPPHPPWLRPPVATWRIRVSDAAVYLVILTATAGTSAWSLRWIPPVADWLGPLRMLTRPGHMLALTLEGRAPTEAVILLSWPWLGPCILLNALMLWGPMLFLRSPRVRPLPIALWVGGMLLLTLLLEPFTGWSPG